MIDLHKQDGLWTVTLNNPDKANALTGAMLTELAEIAESATEARALVLDRARARCSVPGPTLPKPAPGWRPRTFGNGCLVQLRRCRA